MVNEWVVMIRILLNVYTVCVSNTGCLDGSIERSDSLQYIIRIVSSIK